MYGVMWSEHCSYKSSKLDLGRFPTEAPWVLVGPGEGAGVIDIGDGLAVAVRIESHNHPSAVEPAQGAATGVGGIIRDVFSIGARPIALMDPLRFGTLDDARTRYLFEHVVAGISAYGNSVGVPTVGGEAVFDDVLPREPARQRLVPGPRAPRSAGVGPSPARPATWRSSSAPRPGATGSAARASSPPPASRPTRRPSGPRSRSATRSRRSDSSRLASSSSTTTWWSASRTSVPAASPAPRPRPRRSSDAGMDVDVARVPRREPHMNPVEVMTSESQERMLAIIEPRNLDAVLALCARWDIRATVVGHVTDTGRFRVVDGAFDAPTRRGRRPTRRPSARRRRPDRQPRRRAGLRPPPSPARRPGRPRGRRPVARAVRAKFPDGSDLGPELLALLATPSIADKSWVWRQYDHQLFLNTVVGPGADAAVLRLQGTTRGARRSPPTARRASVGSTPAPAPASSCSRRPATSRAPARRHGPS